MTRYAFWLFLVLVISSASHAAEPYVSGSYKTSEQGYEVRFILHNPLPDEILYAWGIFTEDASQFASPLRWTATQNFREVRWICQYPAYQLGPGESLGGFGFTQQGIPVALSFWINSNAAGYRGSVTLIPEPSSLVALGGGGLGLLGAALRRRRRKQADGL